MLKILGLVATAALLASPAFAQKTIVTMKSISFEPKQISINIGDEVEWNNVSYTEHSATADNGAAFDTGSVPPKKSSKPIAFKEAGSFAYHCKVHGKTMSGTILVKAKP